MTIKELTSLLTKKEGKKVQVSVGNVREIVGILSDTLYILSKEEGAVEKFTKKLVANGKRRAKEYRPTPSKG